MPSRQDHIHSYQFMIQRIVAAIVLRETDPASPPFRRVAAATLAGVLVATLSLGAVAGYGMLTGGEPDWRAGDAVIVDTESTTRYVYRDGRLHPVLNLVSALLVLGIAERRTVYVPPTALAGVPRGAPLGIPGAPDALAPPERLLGGLWTVCSPGTPGSAVFVGGGVAGGRPLGPDAGLLVRDGAGRVSLVWRDRRHPVREPEVVLGALGWASQTPVPVAAEVIDHVPAGEPLARITIAGRGKPVRAVPGLRVGEVVMVESQGGGRQYAVALPDGLAGISQVQADLLLGDPATASALGQVRARWLDQGAYALAPKLPRLDRGGDLAPPASTPALDRATGVCVDVGPEAAGVRLDADLPSGAAGVLVPPGHGALVESAGTVSLVTDLGLRHALGAPAVLAMLGYAEVHPVPLPASLIALVPVGATLDPAAVRSYPQGVPRTLPDR